MYIVRVRALAAAAALTIYVADRFLFLLGRSANALLICQLDQDRYGFVSECAVAPVYATYYCRRFIRSVEHPAIAVCVDFKGLWLSR